jgi:hypothetical protein
LDAKNLAATVYSWLMSRQADTALSCRRDDLADIKQLAVELGRKQNRSVPMWEVLQMLIAYYRRGMAIEAARPSSSRPTSTDAGT